MRLPERDAEDADDGREQHRAAASIISLQDVVASFHHLEVVNPAVI